MARGRNHLPASAACLLCCCTWWGNDGSPRVIAARAIKQWRSQWKAVFWYCVLCISFPVWSSRRFLFSFYAYGGSETEIFITVLGESKKGQQTPSCHQLNASFLCAESKVISGPESCPFPWQAADIILTCTKILQQEFLICSRFYKLWKDLYSCINGCLEWCREVFQGRSC